MTGPANSEIQSVSLVGVGRVPVTSHVVRIKPVESDDFKQGGVDGIALIKCLINKPVFTKVRFGILLCLGWNLVWC